MRCAGGGGAFFARPEVTSNTPALARVLQIAATSFSEESSSSPPGGIDTRHAAARCMRRPHGDPSGVCTGHRNPQLSGKSLRTVVVLSSAKYAPRCTERKCETYRA